MNRMLTIASLIFPLISLGGQIGAHDSVDGVRLGVVYERSAEELLPFEITSHLAFRYRPWGTRATEYSCSFSLESQSDASQKAEPGYRLRATVRVPDGPPLVEQIGALMESKPSEPFESLLRRIPIRRYDLFEEDCPAVRSVHEAFFKAASASLSFNLREGPRSHMDGDSVIIEGRADEIFFRASVQRGNALFAWAEEARKALNSCTLP